MRLVSTWLNGIGLQHAIPAFRSAGITTPADLANLEFRQYESLGITSGAERKKLFYLVQRIKMAVENEGNGNNPDIEEDLEEHSHTIHHSTAHDDDTYVSYETGSEMPPSVNDETTVWTEDNRRQSTASVAAAAALAEWDAVDDDEKAASDYSDGGPRDSRRRREMDFYGREYDEEETRGSWDEDEEETLWEDENTMDNSLAPYEYEKERTRKEAETKDTRRRSMRTRSMAKPEPPPEAETRGYHPKAYERTNSKRNTRSQRKPTTKKPKSQDDFANHHTSSPRRDHATSSTTPRRSRNPPSYHNDFDEPETPKNPRTRRDDKRRTSHDSHDHPPPTPEKPDDDYHNKPTRSRQQQHNKSKHHDSLDDRPRLRREDSSGNRRDSHGSHDREFDETPERRPARREDAHRHSGGGGSDRQRKKTKGRGVSTPDEYEEHPKERDTRNGHKYHDDIEREAPTGGTREDKRRPDSFGSAGSKQRSKTKTTKTSTRTTTGARIPKSRDEYDDRGHRTTKQTTAEDDHDKQRRHRKYTDEYDDPEPPSAARGGSRRERESYESHERLSAEKPETLRDFESPEKDRHRSRREAQRRRENNHERYDSPPPNDEFEEDLYDYATEQQHQQQEQQQQKRPSSKSRRTKHDESDSPLINRPKSRLSRPHSSSTSRNNRPPTTDDEPPTPREISSDAAPQQPSRKKTSRQSHLPPPTYHTDDISEDDLSLVSHSSSRSENSISRRKSSRRSLPLAGPPSSASVDPGERADTNRRRSYQSDSETRNRMYQSDPEPTKHHRSRSDPSAKGQIPFRKTRSQIVPSRMGQKRLSTIPSEKELPMSPLVKVSLAPLDGKKSRDQQQTSRALVVPTTVDSSSPESVKQPTPRSHRTTRRTSTSSSSSRPTSSSTNTTTKARRSSSTPATTPRSNRRRRSSTTATAAKSQRRPSSVHNTSPTPLLIHGAPEDTSWGTQVAKLRETNDSAHPLPSATPPPTAMRIRVVVRKRPLSNSERDDVDVVHPLPSQAGDHSLVYVYQPKTRVDLTKEIETLRFAFDNAFDESATNEGVYEASVRHLIPGVFDGRWASVFAYGQTGSGKTYTMMGGGLTGRKVRTEGNGGLYYLAAKDVFRMRKRDRRELDIGASLFEIYSGKLFDLLNKRKMVKCLEDSRGKVCFPGLSEHKVESAGELMALMERGGSMRSTGSTSANADSSRSHAVLQLSLRKSVRGKRNVEFSRLTFIDLAGSERGADTAQASRTTRLEGAEINTSLLALKEVIRALATDSSLSHIPFRGSKLTQVLKESFVGDNSRTVMIACVAPNMNNCEHTLNTLRYADRVKERNAETGEMGVKTRKRRPSTVPPPRGITRSESEPARRTHDIDEDDEWSSAAEEDEWEDSVMDEPSPPPSPPSREESSRRRHHHTERFSDDDERFDDDLVDDGYNDDSLVELAESPKTYNSDYQSPPHYETDLSEEERIINPNERRKVATTPPTSAAPSVPSPSLPPAGDDTSESRREASKKLISTHRNIMQGMMGMMKHEMSLVNCTDADRDRIEEYLGELETLQEKQFDMIATLRQSLLEFYAARGDRYPADGFRVDDGNGELSDDVSFEDLRD